MSRRVVSAWWSRRVIGSAISIAILFSRFSRSAFLLNATFTVNVNLRRAELLD
jgi:hypothetical protein